MSVVFGIPSYDGGKPAFWNCYSRMVRHSRQAGIDIAGSIKVRGCYIEHSRNVTVDKFLNETDAEWLMWLDDDQVFTDDLLIRMLAHGKRIVVGNYYRKQRPYLPIVSVLDDDGDLSPAYMDPATTGLLRVSCAATGCCLTHRSVFETMAFPWFFNDYSAPCGPVSPESMIQGMVLIGEDTRFFMAANGYGFKVWCDFSLEVGHIDGENRIITHEDFLREHERNQSDNQGAGAAYRGICH